MRQFFPGSVKMYAYFSNEGRYVIFYYSFDKLKDYNIYYSQYAIFRLEFFPSLESPQASMQYWYKESFKANTLDICDLTGEKMNNNEFFPGSIKIYDPSLEDIDYLVFYLNISKIDDKYMIFRIEFFNSPRTYKTSIRKWFFQSTFPGAIDFYSLREENMRKTHAEENEVLFPGIVKIFSCSYRGGLGNIERLVFYFALHVIHHEFDKGRFMFFIIKFAQSGGQEESQTKLQKLFKCSFEDTTEICRLGEEIMEEDEFIFYPGVMRVRIFNLINCFTFYYTLYSLGYSMADKFLFYKIKFCDSSAIHNEELIKLFITSLSGTHEVLSK